MTSYVTPKKNAAFVLYVGLPSQASGAVFQSNPTLAAGDAKVSIDGGALANLATLPTVTPAAGKMVKVSLSAAEMNGDNITVVFSDAAGAEWCDTIINIQTSASQIDDLALASTLATVAGYIDTEVAAILAAVDTEVAAIKAKTDSLTFTVAGQLDANVTYWMGTVAQGAAGRPQVDVELWLGSAPNALSGGRVDSTVGAMQANVMTAAAAAADLTTELQNGLATAAAVAVVSADVTSVYNRIGVPVGASISDDIAAIAAGTVTLIGRIPSTAAIKQEIRRAMDGPKKTR